MFVPVTHSRQAVDKCFVANQVVALQATQNGLVDTQIECHGLPIRPAFSSIKLYNTQQLRESLGLDPVASTVLLIGGGEGMGKIAVIAEALSSK